MMRFTYAAKIKPYVRMTQKGKWVDPQAQEYLSSKSQLAYAFRFQMLRFVYEPVPAKVPFTIRLTYQAPNVYQFDLDNVLKAVMDAAQGVVFPDDRWCAYAETMKVRAPTYALHFEVDYEAALTRIAALIPALDEAIGGLVYPQKSE